MSIYRRLSSRASYSDGVLVEPKPGQNADPKPCAGNDGTTITVRVALVTASPSADEDDPFSDRRSLLQYTDTSFCAPEFF
jgi:hypothetical protein